MEANTTLELFKLLQTKEQLLEGGVKYVRFLHPLLPSPNWHLQCHLNIKNKPVVSKCYVMTHAIMCACDFTTCVHIIQFSQYPLNLNKKHCDAANKQVPRAAAIAMPKRVKCNPRTTSEGIPKAL
jgi:hypothetical protein